MELTLFSGIFHLAWWQLVLVTLGLTHITIVGVTVFLHRSQTHRALDMHPLVNHFFRFWLWATTGMATREWVAIHRKHHAKCETAEDPHSPQVLGIHRVLWGGVLLYVKESKNRATIERYGQGTPDDWLERHLYSKYVLLGLTLTGLTDVLLFGILPGIAVLVVQLAWIPFWAAGVINGAGHFWGYRSFPVADASTNLSPWGILIGGEELHNNHHAFPASAKLSNKWFEFDIGWMYIRILSMLGLAHVKHLAPVPRFVVSPSAPGAATLEAVIANRHYVMADYASVLRAVSRREAESLRRGGTLDAAALNDLLTWLRENETALDEARRERLLAMAEASPVLHTIYTMRHELTALWETRQATRAELVTRMQDWCRRAETSGILPLERFSRRLRSFA